MNELYFGDCLDVLKRLCNQHPQPFIDLIYIDPPFNSKRNYNVLFESIDMKDVNAQKQAFADTWSNVLYIVELRNLAELNKKLYEFLTCLDNSKVVNDSSIAYLTTMAIRIYYMHKLLKSTGSFYLHCDQTMSHYLKIICDIIFGEKNFRNEIIWQRTRSAKKQSNSFGRITDILLFYTKTETYTYNKLYTLFRGEYIKSHYNLTDENNRKYGLWDFSQAGQGQAKRFGDKIISPAVGKHWIWSQEKIDEGIQNKRIVFTDKGTPRVKRYLDEAKGEYMSNIWTDIPEINSQAKERLGYPTQKPEALLERIINASSNEGDIVADFFCGCGTSIAAAQKLDRKWLGVDISHLAIRLIIQRLIKTYGKQIAGNIKVDGFPKDIGGAKDLAENTPNGRFSFQDWVIEVLLHGVSKIEKVGDGGFDGYLTYQTDTKKEFVLIEVKSGKVNVRNIREFIQVVDKQKAAAGIFVCFEEQVTREMKKEAKMAGMLNLDGFNTEADRIQILTVDDILNNGKEPHLPKSKVTTFKQAERVKTNAKAASLF